MSETHTTLLPHTPTPIHWRSTAFAAKYFGRTERRIRYWCTQGRFASLGIPVYQDTRKRWWVALEADETPQNTL